MSKHGFIYAMSNKAMPNLFKIGMTDRSPYARAEELSNSTSAPYPFEVCLYAAVETPKNFEAHIHECLSASRVNSKREFFQAHLSEIASVLLWESVDVVLTSNGETHFQKEIISCVNNSLNKGKFATEGQWLLFQQLNSVDKDFILSICPDSGLDGHCPPDQHQNNIFILNCLEGPKRGFGSEVMQ